MVDINQKEIEKLLAAQTDTILNAVDTRFEKMDAYLNERFNKVEMEMTEIRQAIQDLTTTLDNFLKRFANLEEEVTILRAKLNKVTDFIKEKFGVEISAQ